ncbi:MAG: tetratricopeptide repeat protein [Flavobacteriales bacterium]|nr:tetratricopeptide repeat protein [Flavobacteriales bacterium]
MQRKKIFLYLLGIIVFGVINYYQVYSFDFAFDDSVYITDNDYISNGFGSLKEILTEPSGNGSEYYKGKIGAYRPVTQFSFLIDKEVFGLNPSFMHLENLFLYVLTGIILFILLISIYNNILICWISSLIFITLPIHQEVVCNIKSRDDILCLFFFLFSFYLFIKYLNTKKIAFIVLSIVLYFFSLLSKENGITLVLIYPLYLFLFKKFELIDIIKKSIYFFIPCIVFILLHNYINQDVSIYWNKISNNALFISDSILTRKFNAFYLVGVSIYKLIIPYPLLWDYSLGYWNFNTQTKFIGIAVVFLLFFGVIYSYKKNHKLLFCLLFFLISSSLTNNIFIEIPSTFAERFSYTPSLAIAFMIPIIFNFTSINYIIITSIFVLLTHTIYNVYSIKAWKNHLSFGEFNEEHLKSFKMSTNYANALLMSNKNMDKIPELINYSTRIYQPTYFTYRIMGGYYHFKKDYYNALNNYKSAQKFQPNEKNLSILINLLETALKNEKYHPSKLNLLIKDGKIDDALSIINEGLNNPKLDKKIIHNLYYSKGFIYEKSKQYKDAIYFYKLSLDEGYLEKNVLWERLSICYNKINEHKQSIKYLTLLLEESPTNFNYLRNITISYFQINDKENTLKFKEKALKINGNDKTLLSINP